MSKVSFQSPKGELRWVFIAAPGKLNNLNGKHEYTASVSCSMEEGFYAKEAIDKLWAQEKPNGAKEPKSTGYKIDGETITFNFKTQTTYPSGDNKEIRVYNAKAEQIKLPSGKKIGNGSRGRVSGIASVYDAGPAARGVTLYLDAVQLVKYVEYDSGDSFKAEEDGFEGFGEVEFEPIKLD